MKRKLYCVEEREIEDGYVTNKKLIKVYIILEGTCELDPYPTLDIIVDNDKSLEDALSFYYIEIEKNFEIIKL